MTAQNLSVSLYGTITVQVNDQPQGLVTVLDKKDCIMGPFVTINKLNEGASLMHWNMHSIIAELSVEPDSNPFRQSHLETHYHLHVPLPYTVNDYMQAIQAITNLPLITLIRLPW